MADYATQALRSPMALAGNMGLRLRMLTESLHLEMQQAAYGPRPLRSASCWKPVTAMKLLCCPLVDSRGTTTASLDCPALAASLKVDKFPPARRRVRVRLSTQVGHIFPSVITIERPLKRNPNLHGWEVPNCPFASVQAPQHVKARVAVTQGPQHRQLLDALCPLQKARSLATVGVLDTVHVGGQGPPSLAGGERPVLPFLYGVPLCQYHDTSKWRETLQCCRETATPSWSIICELDKAPVVACSRKTSLVKLSNLVGKSTTVLIKRTQWWLAEACYCPSPRIR